MNHIGFICRRCALALSSKITRTSRKTETLKHARNATTASALKQHPYRVGIIGSGPAGFYAALRVLDRMKDNVKVDMYEQLPVPFGLVRFGVAPDHPEVKACQERFSEVAQSSNFSFIGNIEVGKDIPLATLRPHYDALLFAYGASQDRLLGVPGEDLKGVLSARAFVGWYNGLPEYEHLGPDLSSGDTAIIIGQGNVALDIGRILLSSVDQLRTTDISEQALEVLSRSRIKNVRICGRRGPMQAAFTIKEIRELLSLPSVGFEPMDHHLLPTSEHLAALPRLERRKYRLANLLAEGSKTPLEKSTKSWSLLSLLSPKSFDPAPDGNHVNGVTMNRNIYNNDDDRFERDAKTFATDEAVVIQGNLALRSIGYKSVALPGLQTELNVAFDERQGTIKNDGLGRAFRTLTEGSNPSVRYMPKCYCTGWVKNGPTGVIASTMEDAFTTAEAVFSDAHTESNMSGSKGSPRSTGMGWEGVWQDLNHDDKQRLRPIDWTDWQAIDAVEVSQGKAKGKPREKFRHREEMLSAIQ